MAWYHVSWNPFRPIIGYRCRAASLAGSLGSKLRAVPKKGFDQKQPDSLAFLRVGDTSFFLNENACAFIGNKSGCALRIFDESIAGEHALVEHEAGEVATETAGLEEKAISFTIQARSFGRRVIIKSLSEKKPIVLDTETEPYGLRNGDRIFLETTKHDPRTGEIELVELEYITIQRRINGDQPQALSPLRSLETSKLVELSKRSFPEPCDNEAVVRELVFRAQKGDKTALDCLSKKWKIGRDYPCNEINRLYAFNLLPDLLTVVPLDNPCWKRFAAWGTPEIKQWITRNCTLRLKEIIESAFGGELRDQTWLRQHFLSQNIRDLDKETMKKMASFFSAYNLVRLEKDFPKFLDVARERLLSLAVEGDIEAEKAIAKRLAAWEAGEVLALFERGILEKILDRAELHVCIKCKTKLFNARQLDENARLDGPLDVIVEEIAKKTE